MIAMIEFYGSGQRVAHSPQRAPGPEGGQWGAAPQHLSTCASQRRRRPPIQRERSKREESATVNLWAGYLRHVRYTSSSVGTRWFTPL